MANGVNAYFFSIRVFGGKAGLCCITYARANPRSLAFLVLLSLRFSCTLTLVFLCDRRGSVGKRRASEAAIALRMRAHKSPAAARPDQPRRGPANKAGVCGP